ncbi:MAG: hypothetical protein QG657_1242, partial [Acidobacteriota bacterium]|nr:hypothetical protein [Acidobacteriota bacterium]
SLGYRTTDNQAEAIFLDGLALAEMVAASGGSEPF